MTTLIYLCSQCCGNLSAIWVNPHIISRHALEKKVMPTPFHWLILCSTSANKCPQRYVTIEYINNTKTNQNGRQNVPTTYQERCGI